MKNLTLSALMCLALGGCGIDEIKLPKVYGDEVPAEVLNAPRVVPSPPAAAKGKDVWPLVGAVPSKPKDFTPQPVIDAARSQMQNDRNEAARMQDDYQNASPVQ